MTIPVFEGTPKEIGLSYGKALAEQIREVMRILVWREGRWPFSMSEADFNAWLKAQKARESV